MKYTFLYVSKCEHVVWKARDLQIMFSCTVYIKINVHILLICKYVSKGIIDGLYLATDKNFSM